MPPVNEPPFVTETNDVTLDIGMVFSIEPERHHWNEIAPERCRVNRHRERPSWPGPLSF